MKRKPAKTDPSEAIESLKELESLRLRDRVSALRAQLATTRREEITRQNVQEWIRGVVSDPVEPPRWLTPKRPRKGILGVPTLFCSDWHWAESINPAEVAGMNEYNLEVAHERIARLVRSTIYLLKDCLAGAEYDGLVIAFGGDMLAGDIHAELERTNDAPMGAALYDLVQVLYGMISHLADAFGRLYIVGVTGNHGRMAHHKKTPKKQRATTSFDWIAYQWLASLLSADKRVQWSFPEGTDAHYTIYDHRYELTHGDTGQKGGDGIIGPLGPATRGRVRRAARDVGLGRPFDTQLIGHWHRYTPGHDLIINGSLCGYNEYAFQAGYPYERAVQALWITHPEQGITFSIPVYCDEPKARSNAPWVSWVK